MFNEQFVYNVINSLPTEITAGKNALDIGANFGIYTKELANKFSHVYAIEAHPDNCVILKRRLKDYLNTTVINKAVSDKAQTVKLYNCHTNPGGHTISDRIVGISQWGHFKESFVDIDGITIDDLSDQFDFSFIKCDIEGAENFVWKGANKVLSNKRPMILLEVHREVDYQDLADYFRSFNYKLQNDQGAEVTCFDVDQHYLLLPQ